MKVIFNSFATNSIFQKNRIQQLNTYSSDPIQFKAKPSVDYVTFTGAAKANVPYYANKMSIRDLSSEDLKDKNAFVRVDFNVSLDPKTGDITNDKRIRAALPTIEYLLDKGAKVILASHLGDPAKDKDKYADINFLKMDKVAERLSELLKEPVTKLDDSVGPEVEAAVSNPNRNRVILLENTRFNKGETKNNPEYAQGLSKLADVYINDAFGTAHRAHASTAGIVDFVRDKGGKSVSGLLVEKELDMLGKALDNPERKLIAIIGGAKVSSKIDVLNSLLDKSKVLIIGGGMANTFLLAKKYEIGDSLVERDKVDEANKIMTNARSKGVKIILPIDVTILKQNGEVETIAVSKLKPGSKTMRSLVPGWRILDIGPKTAQIINKELAKKPENSTIFWNGPVGLFEDPKFLAGTKSIAESVADNTSLGAISVLGGGDTGTALKKSKLKEDMYTHVSTGGGASIEFVEGKELPGVVALDEK